MLDVRDGMAVDEDKSSARQRSGRQKTSKKSKGLKVDCLFTKPGESPFDGIEWEQRKASITAASRSGTRMKARIHISVSNTTAERRRVRSELRMAIQTTRCS